MELHDLSLLLSTHKMALQVCSPSCYYYLLSYTVIINPRCACTARVTVVGSVCLSVKSHLTYGASVRPENAVTYSAGNEGQNICGVFSETDALQRSSTPSIVRPCVQSAIFPAESTHAHYSIYHVVDRSGHDFSQSVRDFRSCRTPCAEKTVVSFVSCH